MKVSSKIVSGFLILMLLALVLVGSQINVIYRMQSVNEKLAEVDFEAAQATLNMWQIVENIRKDSLRYFSEKYSLTSDNTNAEGHKWLLYYDAQLAVHRQDFFNELAVLGKNARSDKERDESERLSKAFDDYLNVFNRYKSKSDLFDPVNPPTDLISTIDHLQAQTEVAYDAINVSIREQATNASGVGRNVLRLALIAGLSSLLVGGVIAFVFARSINDPLRRLTRGTRAIAKGEFWHRLPAHSRDEFAELARDFNAMSERLGELDQMKRDFVSHVSHDLKAPLASMRQVLHLLLQQIPGPLNEQQKSLLNLSYNSAERLAAMVGNLLDVSRLEAGSMEYEMAPHNLIPMIKSVADEFDVQAREKSVRFRLEAERESLFVKCDRPRILQVIGNLYENALKFSPPNSDIVTRVALDSNGRVRISVTDSGPGVPEGHKEKIFGKFHQVKYGKKIAGQGVGLGLAICKSIVEAHGGPIWVEDNPGGGSVFSFKLHSVARQEVLECGQSA